MSDVCPICGGALSEHEFTVTRDDKWGRYPSEHTSGPATYRECIGCGAMIFKGSWDYGDAYGGGFYYGVDGDPKEFLARRFHQILSLPREKSDNVQRVARIRKFVSDEGISGEVLDVGAGMGVFLHEFLDASWQGTAVETDPNACDHLEAVLPGVTVIKGAMPSDVRYDLITLNRVLEHVPDPLDMLTAQRDLLGHKGCLYVEVPDVQSYFLDGANNEAFGYGHLIVYSPQALTLLSRKAGLEVVLLRRVVEPSAKFTLYAFLKRTSS